MKKLVVTLALIAGIAAHAEEFKFPGTKCADVPLLQQQLALAPNNDYRVLIGSMIIFVQTPPASFAAACDVIDTVADQTIANCPESAKAYYRKQYAYLTHKWLDDLAAFCVAHPSAYDLNIALRGKEQGKAWARQLLIDCLTNFELLPQGVPKGIRALVEYTVAGEVSAEEMKDILQKMDIRYTSKLADDKEKWAPVVARIRTLLERF